jgi:ABC-type multidrug transport system fused ATPase/permease subunit
MRKNMIRMMIAVIAAIILFIWLSMTPGGNEHQQALAQASVTGSVATPSIHSSTPKVNPFSPTYSGWNIDPTLLMTVFSALITGMLLVIQTIYQTRQNIKMQRESLAAQGRQAQELAELQARYDRDLLLLRESIKEQSKERKQQEQQKEDLRQQMEWAQNTRERAQIYRQALQENPRIAYLQILDMNRPLAVKDIYVPIRVHQETNLPYELDPAFVAAETLRQPSTLLQISQTFLDRRISTALELERALYQHKHCVIIGDPGAGKSTILKYLALRTARNEVSEWKDLSLPIHMELSTFVGSGHQNLLDFAATQWQDLYGFPSEKARPYMEEMLEQGKALLLLDALDETVIGETIKEADASYDQVVRPFNSCLCAIAVHPLWSPLAS